MFVCSNKRGKITTEEYTKVHESILIYIHKGSYCETEDSVATVSFFKKVNPTEIPLYLFSFTFGLLKNEKLFGFISSSEKPMQIQLEDPIFFAPQEIFPEKLKIYDKNLELKI